MAGRIVLAVAFVVGGIALISEASLGTDSTSSAGQAVPPWVSIQAGSAHTCGVRADGTLWCWGGDTHGQLGDGTEDAMAVPSQVGSAITWKSIRAGGDHSCGIQADASLWCWGRNTDGELGIGGTADTSTPARVGLTTDRWLEVSTGQAHTCAIRTDGTLWCWGDPRFGELGGTAADPSRPGQVGRATDWVRVDAGEGNTCGLRAAGTLWCWGENDHGQLGDGSRSNRAAPVQVGDRADWTAISTWDRHTCGIRTGGSLWCWGAGSRGELGDGTRRERRTPVRIGSGWADVTLGGIGAQAYTCGIRTSGSLWCWGANDDGQLGDRGSTGRKQPTRVGNTKTWRVVGTGDLHACGTRADGSAWCWGAGSSGQLGIGTFGVAKRPQRVRG